MIIFTSVNCTIDSYTAERVQLRKIFETRPGINVGYVAVGYIARYKIKDHPGRYLVYRSAISAGIEIVVIFL